VKAKLSQNPNDPDICLEAGSYFCFKAHDWDRGLPVLAKGSDTEYHGQPSPKRRHGIRLLA
jgi:hypothetical protein